MQADEARKTRTAALTRAAPKAGETRAAGDDMIVGTKCTEATNVSAVAGGGREGWLELSKLETTAHSFVVVVAVVATGSNHAAALVTDVGLEMDGSTLFFSHPEIGAPLRVTLPTKETEVVKASLVKAKFSKKKKNIAVTILREN